jgi:molybdopterin-containing oxidoreductase family membrane subunit
MGSEKTILGIFQDEDQTANAIRALRDTSWGIKKVLSPIPGLKIFDALNLKKSRVGYFTLIGGIIGFFAGFGFAAFTALQWELVVGGKPVVAFVPFFIVGFEFTILFAVFGNVVGLIHQMKLPDYRGLVELGLFQPSNRFCIMSTCPIDEEESLKSFFRQCGAEDTIII